MRQWWARWLRWHQDADAALTESREAKERIEARSEVVSRTADELRSMRSRNHFAEQIERALRGTP